ncbi:unnamed protein product [Paramecium primaurelia]|uniref:Transmembrane protein n=1 Tax=Paramecium primaurelia TaxID=5886 RepID=A0A8S1KPQ3_PARPR|nr:unnamed protein product [Paramecium primaurelia]
MEQALKTLQTKLPTKPIQLVFIKKNSLNRKYSPFKIQINQSSKYQQMTETQREQIAIKQSHMKRIQKGLSSKKQCTQNQQNKQLISMPQQLHQKFLCQKQKDLVQILIICLTILSLIVIIFEYHQQENNKNFQEK